MELNYETGVHMLSLTEYAAEQDMSTRQIKRWLAAGQLPSAVKDPATGEWRIPAGAARVFNAAPAAQTQPQDHSQAALQLVTALGAQQGELVPWQEPRESEEPSRREQLDDEPGFLDLPTAARYLGIPQAQILKDPKRFGIEARGVSGAPRVPQRIVRRIMGY